MKSELYDMTVKSLKDNWLSTRQLVIKAGISADRYRRMIPGVLVRTVEKHGRKIKEYHLPTQLMLF